MLKLILIIAFFLWQILKALWVTITPPTGTEISKDQAPALFAIINELRQQLGAPHFHHILITDEFNAGVVQSPRLGIFGWPRNYLLIGLPLMKSLTVEQFKAVLAHELGHLAKGHGRSSNWIYRQRLRWSRLLTLLNANDSKGSFLFKPFLQWFAPYFSAYSFPLARVNEYAADATSVRLTSPRVVAEALTSVSVVGRYLSEQYWPEIHKQADDNSQPNFLPYYEIGRGFAKDLDNVSTQKWLNQALAQSTNSADTHPSLSDRLKAIGESAYLALPSEGQGADQLLGDALASITESFDKRWQDMISPSWERHYHEIQDSRLKLSELNTRVEGGAELSVEDANERALLTELIDRNSEDALEQLRILYNRTPDNPTVCFNLGVRLLNLDDVSGCAMIEHAIFLDENAIVSGSQLLRDYYWRNDQKTEAEAWHQRLVARVQLLESASTERQQVFLGNKYLPHGLSDEVLISLRDALKGISGLRRGYLVRKQVTHFTDIPFYVFSYKVTGFLQFHSKTRVKKVLQQIQENVNFPGETLIINVDGNNYKFDRKFRRMRGARVL